MRNSGGLFVSVGVLVAMAWMPLALASSTSGIPFDLSRGAIEIEGTVNGERARIVLDSGSDLGAMSQSFADRAGISVHRGTSVTVNLAGGPGAIEAFPSEAIELELDGQNLRMQDLIVVPGINMDIILGRSVFRQTVVQIDYPNQRVRFFAPDGLSFEGNVTTRVGQGGHLLVETMIQGSPAWLALDTGIRGPTVLTRRFVRRHQLQGFEAAEQAIVEAGIGEDEARTLLAFDDALLGPFPFSGSLALFDPDGQGFLDRRHVRSGGRIPEAQIRFDGQLGYDVLRNFVVTADFGNNQLHLYLPQS